MKIFLDTNVLVSAVISRGLCRDLLATALEEHDVVVSQLVIEEFERVLRDKFGATQPALDKALMVLDDVEVTTNPTAALEAGALETNDTLILTAATDARADVFVTGDQKLLAAGEGMSLPVVSPRRFMELVRLPGDSYRSPPDENGEPRVSESTTGAAREKAFEFALSVVALCKILEENQQHAVASQLLRAGTGVGANVEEAAAAERRGDFIHKMTLASKEARRSMYWLRLIAESDLVPGIDTTAELQQAQEIGRLLSSIV